MNKQPRIPLRRLAGIAALLAGLLLIIFLAARPTRVQVQVAPLRQESLRVTVDEDGRTRVKDRYVISAPLTGTLGRIQLQPGDSVQAEAVLARLAPLPAPLLDARTRQQSQARLAATSAAYQQAQAAQAQAEADFTFTESQSKTDKALATQGSIPQQHAEEAAFTLKAKREALASARFAVRVAHHEVQLAQAALQRHGRGQGGSDKQLLLRAPVEGVVLEVFRTSAGVIQSGTPLLEIGNPKALEIFVDVLSSAATRIQPGARAYILHWGGDTPLDAHVRRVQPKAFSRTSSLGVEEQRVNVILDLDAPQEAWAQLGDGFRVEASIVLWEKPKVPSIPVSAIFRQDDKWAVFVVDNAVARLRHIEIGVQNELQAQVLGGLEADAQVILYPGERVSDGTHLEVTP